MQGFRPCADPPIRDRRTATYHTGTPTQHVYGKPDGRMRAHTPTPPSGTGGPPPIIKTTPKTFRVRIQYSPGPRITVQYNLRSISNNATKGPPGIKDTTKRQKPSTHALRSTLKCTAEEATNWHQGCQTRKRVESPREERPNRTA